MYAKKQEIDYENAEKDTIARPSLKHVVDVAPVLFDKFKDGTKLHARHFRNLSCLSFF